MSLNQPKMRTFKDFELDTERRVVRGPVGIAPLSLRSTQLLIELMTVRVCRPRRSLMRRLWPDRKVSENSLDQLTSEVRSALIACGSSLTVKSFGGERVCLVEVAELCPDGQERAAYFAVGATGFVPSWMLTRLRPCCFEK